MVPEDDDELIFDAHLISNFTLLNITDIDPDCFPTEAGECFDMAAYYDDTKSFERMIGVIIPAIFAVVVVVGFFGNVLVIFVALGRQMRNSTNTLIIGLALSDLLFLLICIPVTALDYATNTWLLPEWMCSLINYFQHCSAYFSVWTLTLMALDRFLAVCFPVGSMTLRNTRNTTICLCVIYSLVAVSQVSVAFSHGLHTYSFFVENRSACAHLTIATGNATQMEARTYFGSFNLFGYVVPLGITSVLYYCMLRRLWRTPRPGTATSISASMRNRPETVRSKKKVTRLVLSVIVIWAACWLPINICFLLSGVLYPESLVSAFGKPAVIAQISSQVLAYMNSCLNPILYALMSENFRKGFVRILRSFAQRASLGLLCAGEPAAGANERMEMTHYNTTGATTTFSLRRLKQKSGGGGKKSSAASAAAHATNPQKRILHTSSAPAMEVSQQTLERSALLSGQRVLTRANGDVVVVSSDLNVANAREDAGSSPSTSDAGNYRSTSDANDVSLE